MIRELVTVGITSVALAMGVVLAEDRPVVEIWPDGAPGEAGELGRGVDSGRGDGIARQTDVGVPTLEVWRPAAGVDTGAAVLVCPGGGYNILAIEHEGTMVCEWLNRHGVTGLLLRYRVPRREGRDPHEAPLEDALRAMRLSREKAEEWGIDGGRIGILGFSAGGDLALRTALAGEGGGEIGLAGDGADEQSGRPDFAVLVYPAYMVNEGGQLVNFYEDAAWEAAPPMFFAHAHDDPHSAAGSARAYLRLKEAGVVGELHVYAKGGHGFGMFPDRGPASGWPEACAAWMGSMGWLGSVE
jgi:acetyl esterase/lipase